VWKEALVVPIPKVQGSSLASDYRPISLLPLASKLVESHINQVYMSMINHKLSNVQYGFRQGRSTVDAIVSFQHAVLRGFEKCEKANVPTRVIAVFFDLAKAFDTVPHANLIKCLTETYKLPNRLIQLMTSYLTDRKMTVKVENARSDCVPVSSGVPQGSVIGPSLFISFINTLAELSLSCDSTIILYADDAVLIHPLWKETSTSQLQRDINLVNECVQTLGLRLNISKCQFVKLSLSKTEKTPVTLTLNDQALKQVPCYRYLGVEVEENLNFACQTATATLKAKQGIGLMNRALRKWVPVDILSTAITAIVLPALFYAIEAWFPPNECNQKQLERVNKFAIRLLLNDFKHETTYEELLSKIKWKSIARRVAERRLLCVKKYMDGSRFIPPYIFTLQPPCTARRSQRIEMKTPKHSLQLSLSTEQNNSLEAKLAIEKMKGLWNALPPGVISLPFIAFKETITKIDVVNKEDKLLVNSC
jgi:hypothetical protein